MIQANCFVFPKPKMWDIKLIEKHLVYIPKNTSERHYYSSQKTTDDLTYAAPPTVRSKGQLSPQVSLAKFQSILNFNRHCISGHIPCVYLKGSFQQNKLIIYFHSNAEDIVSAFNLIEAISNNLGRSVLMMEYPGYSIYQHNVSNEKQHTNFFKRMGGRQKRSSSNIHKQTTTQEIERDAIKVVQYMKETIGYKLKDISIMGRSIGSGPAIYAASIYSVGSLILLSPFLSLKEVVRDIYGQLCSLLIKQRFNNKERAKLIKCPTLIIHGLLDTIVPPKHSIDLHKQFVAYSTLKLVEKMKHNSFHLHRDFMVYVKDFIRNVQLNQVQR